MRPPPQPRVAARTETGERAKGRDSVRSTWRGNCRTLAEGDLFSCVSGAKSFVRRGSAHGVMFLQFVLQIIRIEHLVAFRAADIFMPGHVLHLAQVVPL